MIKRYHFQMQGTAAQGQTWAVSGDIEAEWHDVLDVSMKHTFGKLTQGKAVYGKPGVGCRGPYNITLFKVEQYNEQGRTAQ